MKQILQILILAAFVALNSTAHATPIDPTTEVVRFAELPDSGFETAMAGYDNATVDLSTYNELTGEVAFHGSTITFRDKKEDIPIVYDNSVEPTALFGPTDLFVGTRTSLITAAFDGLNVVGIKFDMETIWSSARGWLGADLEGAYIQSDTFRIGDGVSSYGIFLANPAQSCGGITNAYIDPPANPAPNWGIRNITLYTGPVCSSVPEPGSLPLLLSALMMFAILGKRLRKNVALTPAS